MPWSEQCLLAQPVLTHNGLTVFHAYRDNEWHGGETLRYSYALTPYGETEDGDSAEFDIRDYSIPNGLDAHNPADHPAIIRAFLDDPAWVADQRARHQIGSPVYRTDCPECGASASLRVIGCTFPASGVPLTGWGINWTDDLEPSPSQVTVRCSACGATCALARLQCDHHPTTAASATPVFSATVQRQLLRAWLRAYVTDQDALDDPTMARLAWRHPITDDALSWAQEVETWAIGVLDALRSVNPFHWPDAALSAVQPMFCRVLSRPWEDGTVTVWIFASPLDTAGPTQCLAIGDCDLTQLSWPSLRHQLISLLVATAQGLDARIAAGAFPPSGPPFGPFRKESL